TVNPGGVSKRPTPKPIPACLEDDGTAGPLGRIPSLTIPQGNPLPRLAFACGTLGLILALAARITFGHGPWGMGPVCDSLPFFGGCGGALLGLLACPLALAGVVGSLRRSTGRLGWAVAGVLTGLAAALVMLALIFEAISCIGC